MMRQMSRTRPKAARHHLTRREREIVNVLFELGNRAPVEDIRARLSDPPGDSSVRVMLARLERKGVLRRQQEGPRYLYSVTTPPAVAKKNALQQYVQTFFGGSLTRMVASLVAESPWSDGDLDALTAEINRVRKDRKERKRQS